MTIGRTCTICVHDQREAIDLALGNGKSAKVLARRFAVSQDALDRHRARHLQPSIARAAARREELSAEALVQRLLGYMEAAEAGIEAARKSSDLSGLARCIKEAHAVVLSIGKTIGLWSDRPQIVNDNRRQIAINLDARSLDELLAMRCGLEELGVTTAALPAEGVE
jgi:hypothetical protein